MDKKNKGTYEFIGKPKKLPHIQKKETADTKM